MAKNGVCIKCRVRWDIHLKDQTPLRLLKCPQCGESITLLHSSEFCFRRSPGEPVLK